MVTTITRKPKSAASDPITLANNAMTVTLNEMSIHHPFFMSLSLRRPRTWTTDVAFAAVDARGDLYLNPHKFVELTTQQRIFLMSHEMLHIINRHLLRRGSRDPKQWNYATDAWINESLIHDGVGSFIKDGIRLEGAHLLSAEDIYKHIDQPPPHVPINPRPADDDNQDQQPQPPTGSEVNPTPPGQPEQPEQQDEPMTVTVKDKDGKEQTKTFTGKGYGDEEMPCPNGEPTADELSDLNAELEVAVLQAAKAAEVRGKMPESIKKLVASIRESKIAWHERLYHLFSVTSKTEVSWTRRNRRFADVYLPSNCTGYIPGRIVYVIDVSGSITQPAIECVNGHLQRMMEEFKPEAIDVLYTDTRVVRHDVYEDDEVTDFQVQYVSGGGTHMEAAFKYMRDNDMDDVNFIVVFTDAYDSYDVAAEPDAPVVWVIDNKDAAEPPYGMTIRAVLDDNQQ